MFVLLGSPRTQGVFAALCALGGLVFFGLVFYGSLGAAANSWLAHEFEGDGALRVPFCPARFALVVVSFLSSLISQILLVSFWLIVFLFFYFSFFSVSFL